MRFVRNLALLAITAIAALALSATSASAQIEVSEESSGEHCDPVCLIQAHSEGNTTTITAHVSGMEFVQSVCDDEFHAEIDENGEGEIYEMILTGPEGVCNSVPCANAAGQVPWPFHLNEDAPGVEELEVRFCLFAADGSFTFCTIDAALTEDVEIGDHHYELRAADENCHGTGENPAVEVDGHWLLNGEDADATPPETVGWDVEINHPEI